MGSVRRLAALAAVMVGAAALGTAPGAQASHKRPGCDGVDRQGRSVVQLQSGGVERSAVVHVPSAYDGKRRLALVLTLHGSNSNPVEQLARSRMEQASERHGFIAVAPQGGIASGANWSWNIPHVTAGPAGAPDDERYLTDLITTLTATLCVDPKQVYASGYSGGGRMISQYACDGPGLLAAIAPVAGLRAGRPVASGSGLAPDPATCRPDRPVPVITFAGTADPVNPFAGGGAAYWGYGIPAAQQRWAELNACKRGPATSQVTASVTRAVFSSCRKNAQAHLYVVAGGGHTWPGGDPAAFPAGLGTVTQEIDANDLMWAFFRNPQSPTRGT
ncbi:extracellular catalytic domain type 1 short-chain-length polyhydroxyalkanoate depolymerase [Motilibacter deserti]|uniref:Polyhydroxybutyrate depolymerase n=1 Tax=Motilibacter deserti TaxID=2714956 RepID=A0ABX0GPJ1_9ACTN|nr:PHB depolymerase family esterase [Motilibacter deserti]NHC12385.1 polyhydroxybutyrate depolymerase [Motilibacter deserti]